MSFNMADNERMPRPEDSSSVMADVRGNGRRISLINQKPDITIYAGKCTPIMLNPNMMITLKKVFNINTLTSVKKDLDKIVNRE